MSTISLSEIATRQDEKHFNGVTIIGHGADCSMLEEKSFVNCDFRGRNVTAIDFKSCHFEECKFDDALWLDCIFDSCRFRDLNRAF